MAIEIAMVSWVQGVNYWPLDHDRRDGKPLLLYGCIPNSAQFETTVEIDMVRWAQGVNYGRLDHNGRDEESAIADDEGSSGDDHGEEFDFGEIAVHQVWTMANPKPQTLNPNPILQSGTESFAPRETLQTSFVDPCATVYVASGCRGTT